MKKGFSFRPSTLSERKEFYSKEFSVAKIKKWFVNNGVKIPQICALDAGSETSIIVDKKLKNQMLYFPFSELKKQTQKYLPEDVYYLRNFYNDPERRLESLNFKNYSEQELDFDLDFDNINCKKVDEDCLKKIFEIARKMKKELENFGFKKVLVVYSGRGFHLHVLDKKAFKMNNHERARITKKFLKYPIDEWVSQGHIGLIRMPYSLNGLVSRKVTPMKNKFDTRKTIPKFIKN